MSFVRFTLDVQFVAFMQLATDLSKTKIYRVFDMLDVDHSGLIDFDEFYILICVLLAVRVRVRELHFFLYGSYIGVFHNEL